MPGRDGRVLPSSSGAHRSGFNRVDPKEWENLMLKVASGNVTEELRTELVEAFADVMGTHEPIETGLGV